MKNDGLISEEVVEVDPEDPNSGISDNTLMTVDEVAEFLRLKPETIRSMARRGDLPGIKLGRVWRFRRTSISQILEA